MGKILVACEESQALTIRLREIGHEAFSCDILPCSGGHPEWPLQQDVTDLLTQKWDMMIAFTPCTFLTISGNRWFDIEKYGEKAIQRIMEREKAIDFFMMLVNADCEKIAIENPIGVMSKVYRKPDQIIQPYQFGDPFQKSTCLWLKGLPKLKPTKVVDKGEFKIWTYKKTGRVKKQPMWYFEAFANNDNKSQRSSIRSKTFSSIASAMAEQWGIDLN